MTTPDLWEDFARRSRALYEQQAALARTWLDGQTRLAGTLAGLGGQGEGGIGAEAAALAELWRSWLALGSALPGLTMPGLGEPGRIAGETLGRFLDPVSLALVGGSQVGETIRRLTEGPRFADMGALERRMARVMELWLEVQHRARLRGRGRRRLGRGQPALRQGVPGARPGRQGAGPAQGGAQALARHRQPHPARDAPLAAVPGGASRAPAPGHGLPPGRARAGRGLRRAGEPADAHRDRRGIPLGPGAQAAGARTGKGRRSRRAARAAAAQPAITAAAPAARTRAKPRAQGAPA
jgi:hypothetical protein